MQGAKRRKANRQDDKKDATPEALRRIVSGVARIAAIVAMRGSSGDLFNRRSANPGSRWRGPGQLGAAGTAGIARDPLGMRTVGHCRGVEEAGADVSDVSVRCLRSRRRIFCSSLVSLSFAAATLSASMSSEVVEGLKSALINEALNRVCGGTDGSVPGGRAFGSSFPIAGRSAVRFCSDPPVLDFSPDFDRARVGALGCGTLENDRRNRRDRFWHKIYAHGTTSYVRLKQPASCARQNLPIRFGIAWKVLIKVT